MSAWSNLLDRIMRPSIEAAYERGWADGADAIARAASAPAGHAADCKTSYTGDPNWIWIPKYGWCNCNYPEATS